MYIKYSMNVNSQLFLINKIEGIINYRVYNWIFLLLLILMKIESDIYFEIKFLFANVCDIYILIFFFWSLRKARNNVIFHGHDINYKQPGNLSNVRLETNYNQLQHPSSRLVWVWVRFPRCNN